MDIAARFHRAMQPDPPRCLGLQLMPYSLGHHIILQQLEISFAFDSPPTFSDLIVGALVCSQTWEEWQKTKRSPWLKWFLRLWGWRCGKFNIEEQAKILQKHTKVGRECPELVTKVNGGSPLEMPWENRLKILLMSKFGMSESEALNRPLARSNLDWVTYGEMEGTVTPFSSADEYVLEYHKNRLRGGGGDA